MKPITLLSRVMTTSTIVRAARIARAFLPALAALLAGCHREPAPPAPASASASAAPEPAAPRATKLAGAPAHVLKASFSPDGASVLVLEERRKQGDDARGVGAFVISRRPTDGGAAVDLFAPAEKVVAMAPLGDAVVALTRPLSLEETGEPPPEGDGQDEDIARRLEARSKMVLHRIVGGAAPVRISPERMYCTSLVSAPGGQWAAFSLAKNDDNLSPDGNEETHVLGVQPGEDITLEYRSRVYDISPDGARVLMLRKQGKTDRRSRSKEYRPDGASERVIVSVKDRSVTNLPEELRVEGAGIDTAALRVSFAADGLEFAPSRELPFLLALDNLMYVTLTEIDASLQGDRYHSALDGTGATRLTGPKRDARADGDAGAPAKERRWISPKGMLYELREDEAGTVVLSRGAGPDALAPVTRFEGPLSGIPGVALDAAEKRAALVVLSDTSRDGQLDSRHDDAEIFLVDLDTAAAAPLGFGRAEVALLADEIRPKIAAAAGIPEASVTVTSEKGDVKAIATIPWVDGEDAKTLLARMFTTARAIDAALPHWKFSLHVRAGEIDLGVYESDRRQSPRHLLLGNQGMSTADPTALTLVHKDPRLLSMLSVDTLTGELENTGTDPTPPIEVYSVNMEGTQGARKRIEVKKDLGVIEPGKSAKYSIGVSWESAWDDYGHHASFRAEGKQLAAFNTYAYDHTFDALRIAIEAHARLGVWVEHREAIDGGVRVLARLTAEQAALGDRAREALFKSVRELFADHRKKFHHGHGERIAFAAPGGGGWLSEVTKKPKRFEGDAEGQFKEGFER
jgi:hypothetical protein